MQVSATPADPPLPGNCSGQQRQVGCCSWGPPAFKESPAASPSPRPGLLACLARQEAPNNCETLFVSRRCCWCRPKLQIDWDQLGFGLQDVAQVHSCWDRQLQLQPSYTTAGVRCSSCSSETARSALSCLQACQRLWPCQHPGCCCVDSSSPFPACQAASQRVL